MSAGLEVIIEAVFGRDAARTWLATGRTGLLDHARQSDATVRRELLALLLARLAAHPMGTGPAAVALRACLVREAQGLGSPGHVGSDGIPADAGSGTELEFVIMVIAVSCVKLLSAHNSTQHTSRKHKV
jgi:hypothetical protein